MSDTVVRARSVRYRLLAIALLPTLVILPLLLGVTMFRWNEKFDATLITKVHGDLTIAHQYLARILENTQEQVAALAGSARFRDALVSADGRLLPELLSDGGTTLDLDFLYLADASGAVIAASGPGNIKPRTDWPVVRAALAGQPQTGIDIFSSDELAAISPQLAERARVELVPTPNAAPSDRSIEMRGMVVHSTSPVTLPDGRPAALVGGILLNRNLVFIDTINDLVYRAASLPEGSQGTATLFLEDVRISTNVRLFEGRRALGTRVSAAVREAVLGQGRTWLDSAFVVNDWYISAYEPIVDSSGTRVGMLYVGFLERPFTEAKTQTILLIVATFLLVTAASVPLFLRWAGGIFRPLEEMAATIDKVEQGDLGARTGAVEAKDEIGLVALHLDHLLDQLQQRDRQLRSWNEELNARVEERTQELQLANRKLETTTRQLIMSEKLASIGEITAGVAHEINNPIAVMQGNLEIVRSVMGPQASKAETEFRLLDEQVQRIHQIVTKLLQFARPEEYAGYVERNAPGAVISDTIPLVQHLLTKTEIAIDISDRAQRRVLMNRTELQQVLVNLIVNAIHAMPNGGTLRLNTADVELDGQAGVAIGIEDTGVGMTPDVLAKVFDAFFTTKRREGTGLGLSISQTLVSRQGGRISATSEPGYGTSFTVWLPEAS